MDFQTPQTIQFNEKVKDLSKDEILKIIESQSPQYIKEINRIEWVFRNKLSHINDTSGSPIIEKDFTKDELLRLIDPPFFFSKEMMKKGFNEEEQRQIHIASDPVLWSKQILNATPRAYQALVMRETNDQVVLRWGRRLGKALSVDTKIPTPDGFKSMGDIQVGDKVFDEKGRPCNVIDATDYQYDRQCFRVKFSDKTEIIADADHVWTVQKNAREDKTFNITTKEIFEANTRFYIKNPEAIQYSEKKLHMDPWVYGYLICNLKKEEGALFINKKDQPFVSKRFREAGYELEQIKNSFFEIAGFDFEDIEVDHIHPDYLFSSFDQRMELLRGICDARVYLHENKYEINMVSESFVNEIKSLLYSMGYEPNLNQRMDITNGVEYGPKYRLRWPQDPSLVNILRKKSNDEPRKKSGYRSITKVTAIESQPVKCIGVDSESRLFLASDSYIPTHNSFFLSMYIIWYAFVHPKARILVMAPAKTQVGLIYEQILELVEESPIVKNAITKKPRSPQYEVWLSNGSSIKLFTTGFRSGGKSDGVRGQEADMIVLDEMDYMGSEDLVALMAMLQDTDPNKIFNKKLIGASTPTGQRSTYYHWNVDPKYNFSSYYYPSYVNPLWNQKEEEKARLRYRNEQHYRHEIEADWGEDAEGVYPRKYVDIAFANEEIKDYKDFKPSINNYIYTLGVDWDKHGAGVNIAILQASLNNPMAHPIKLVYREEIAKGNFTYLEAVDYIIKLNNQYQFAHVYIDQGAGEVQHEMLVQYGIENPSTRLHTKTKACHFSNVVEIRDPYTRKIAKKRLKPFMIDSLIYQLEQSNIQFGSDDELFLQLISYIKIRETESGNPVFAPGGETVDHAHDALVLALYALVDNYDAMLSGPASQAPKSFSNSFFMPDAPSDKKESINKVEKPKSEEKVSKSSKPRGKSFRSGTKNRSGSIKRSSF